MTTGEWIRRGPKRAGKGLALACATLSVTACGGGATRPAALEVSCPEAPLRLDQITAPGFELEQGSSPSAGAEAAGAAAARAVQPQSAGEVRYFRPTRDLATSNGPVEISARAACYRDTDSASRALGALGRAARPGEVALSPGALGDEAQAGRRRATLPSGTAVAQITVRWRLATVLNTLTVRGREGAFGLGEVLTLASRQQENELAIATASPVMTGGGTAPVPS